MPDEPSFEISEVALMLGMPQTRVKNWTIGRPLAIKPSVRRAKGTGKRNLYGSAEVFLMALAQHLASDGFGMEAVEEVIKKVGKAQALADYLVIYRPARGATFELKRVQALMDEPGLTKLLSVAGNPISTYVLNLKRFKAHVDESIRMETIFGVPPGKLSRKGAAAIWEEDQEF